MKNKIQSNSGSSILFVLAVSMLFFIIGTSVLIASSTAAGVASRQKQAKQLEVYLESVLKSFNNVITTTNPDSSIGMSPDDMSEHGLGMEIVAGLYNENAAIPPPSEVQPNPPMKKLTDFEVSVSYSGEKPADIAMVPVKIHFLEQDCHKTAGIPAIDLDEDGIADLEELPQKTYLNLRFTATVKGNYGAARDINQSYEITYRYTDGLVEQKAGEGAVFADLGNWEVESCVKKTG